MSSPAERYKDALEKVANLKPQKFELDTGVYADVNSDGDLKIEAACVLAPAVAKNFAVWIIQTFGIPDRMELAQKPDDEVKR